MKRHAFKMKLKPGCESEYRRRHDEIWPELADAIRKSGISDYSIFLDDETLTLFAVQKMEGPDSGMDLPNHPVVRKWWSYMADLMEVYPDNSPVCNPLKEVFYLS